MKILIIDESNENSIFEVTPKLINQIESLDSSIEVKISSGQEKVDLTGVEVLICRGVALNKIIKIEALKWLHLTSAGVGKLPDSILSSDILVTNSSGVHPIPIAEQVLVYMLMFGRGIPNSFRNQLQKKWGKERSVKVFELFGKTVLIVGFGKIGQKLGEYCGALGMKVLGTNSKTSGIEFREKLKISDFVVNCLPGTEQTWGIFKKDLFASFKRGSYFINIGRGTSVIEQDLIEALESGQIKGAGLDVFEVEPLPIESPLWEMEQVIITPHYAGWTPHYMERVIEIFIKNLKSYLKKEMLPNLVDKQKGY